MLQTALRASPSHTEAIYNLALADDLAGRADRAAYGYGRFLALASHADPQRARVQQRLELLMGANVPAAPAPVSTAGATTASANDSERGSAVAAPSPESREGTHP